MKKHRGSPRSLAAAALFCLLITPSSSPASPATDTTDKDARSLALKAEKAFSGGNLRDAEILYSKALESSPSSVPIMVSLAAVKTRLGNLDGSNALLKRALKIDLENAPAWLLLGMNALEQNHDEEALADLMQAVLRDDRNPRAHSYLGIAAGRKGWSDISEQELRRAVELDPGYSDANFNLAVFYLRRTPPLLEQGRRHYQRALELGAAKDPAIEAQLAKAVATPAPPQSPSAALP
jgi:Tfp pilus assembly protein PilF